jgi:hypothetical protein
MTILEKYWRLIPLAEPRRGHAFKLKKSRCNTRLRQSCFSQRVINAWNTLPEGVVNSPTISCFKVRLDNHWEDKKLQYKYIKAETIISLEWWDQVIKIKLIWKVLETLPRPDNAGVSGQRTMKSEWLYIILYMGSLGARLICKCFGAQHVIEHFIRLPAQHAYVVLKWEKTNNG